MNEGFNSIKEAASQIMKDGFSKKDALRLIRFIIIVMIIAFIVCATIFVLKIKNS